MARRSENDSNRPTLQAVADRANVALSTASRVLNNGSASPELRDRVLTAVDEIGYRPHGLARSLRSGTTKTMGFLVPDIANPLFGFIARGAAAHLGAAGYSMILAVSNGLVERERSLIRNMMDRRVDGLILSCSDELDPDLPVILKQLAVPMVLLDREVAMSGAHRVLVDHRAGMYEAVDHLVELGHRRIALVCGTPNTRPSRERFKAFAEVARDRGVFREELVAEGTSINAFGRSEVQRLLSSADPPTAFIAGGNQHSTAVLAGIRDARRRIPAELSFVGCDDIDALALNNPPMTVISRSVEFMGSEAARLLLESLSASDSDPASNSVTRYIPTQLVIRRSTSKCP